MAQSLKSRTASTILELLQIKPKTTFQDCSTPVTSNDVTAALRYHLAAYLCAPGWLQLKIAWAYSRFLQKVRSSCPAIPTPTL